MNDKKPSVFPTPEERASVANKLDKDKLIEYEKNKISAMNDIYNNSSVIPSESDTPNNYNPNKHYDAIGEMKERTNWQLNKRNETGEFNGVVKHPEFSETQIKHSQKTSETITMDRTEEQMKLRDEQLRKNQIQTQKYQNQSKEASIITKKHPNNEENMNNNNNNNNNNGYIPPSNNGYNENMGQNPSNINPYIISLSQPNYNAPFDVIPLTSEGKLYKNKKPNIRIGFMTTADENILTSPNLLQSGEFLEILINRKILESELRYKDLIVGDRNAIMIWLRATGYGEMYPVTLMDENDVPFETDINLNELKSKKLGAEPDSEGLFDFKFPLCKANIKFKLLTCGDIDEIEQLVEADKTNNVPVNNTNTYTMERTIVEVNGNRDKNVIKDFSSAIRIKDAKDLNDYIDTISCGIDLNIEVGTPGGGSIKTFLPLNVNFFWPNVKL
jgi:hypothetical protein